MRFWAAVSTIAGALQRKVWIDQVDYEYHPNFYIILVAPPGIARKTSTIDAAHTFLRELEVNWGPDVATWQSLVTSFAEARQTFIVNGVEKEMNAITIAAGEFGTLFDPEDRKMVDCFVALWDSRRNPFTKTTKHNGTDVITQPWINLIACTTPSWIEGYFPEYMIGGGFVSRCVFVYADKKDKLIAYPRRHVQPESLHKTRLALTEDLKQIAKLQGEYEMSEAAYQWGEKWYEHSELGPKLPEMEDDRYGGYLARKQTMMHKLAMVLAASQRDELVILPEDLQVADRMLLDIEQDLPKVFEKIGKSSDSMHSERIVQFVRRRGTVSYVEVYRFGQAHFSDSRKLDSILAALIRAGKINLLTESGVPIQAQEVKPGMKVLLHAT